MFFFMMFFILFSLNICNYQYKYDDRKIFHFHEAVEFWCKTPSFFD